MPRCRPNRRLISALLSATLLAAAGSGLAACEPEVHTRGNLLTPAKMASLQAGSTTRAQVSTMLGTPSMTSLFDGGETWFYIGSKTRQYAVYPVEEMERQIIAISFDGNGVLSQVKSLNKEDGTEVTLVERITPTAGNELTLMEQLMGNIGRFSSEGKSPQGITRKTGGY